VVEALAAMYVAGVRVRQVEDIADALSDTPVRAGTPSRRNQEIYRHIDAWRMPAIDGEFSYVRLDGMIRRRSWARVAENVAVFVANGVGADGGRQIIGAAEGPNRNLEGWRYFLRRRQDGSLKRPRIVSDSCRGLVPASIEVFPDAAWHRRVVHRYRNVHGQMATGEVAGVSWMLETIHATEDRASAEVTLEASVAGLRTMRPAKAAVLAASEARETLTNCRLPSNRRRQPRTNKRLERIIREFGRRTLAFGALPIDRSALMLVAARLQHVASAQWGRRRYMSMDNLLKPAKQEAAA
jgi:putative transposase